MGEIPWRTRLNRSTGSPRMLNTTLDLAEARAGALKLRKETVSLSDLIQQLADLYHPAMAEHDQELSLHLESQVMVETDVADPPAPLSICSTTNLLICRLGHEL